MKVFNFNSCLHKNLLGLWSWSINIWTKDGFMADLELKSNRHFETEEEAKKNMNEILELIGLHY